VKPQGFTEQFGCHCLSLLVVLDCKTLFGDPKCVVFAPSCHVFFLNPVVELYQLKSRVTQILSVITAAV